MALHRLKAVTGLKWLKFANCLPYWQQSEYLHTPRNLLKLSERGLIKDCFPHENTHKFAAYLEAAPRVVYAGFDPTANSLHIGNLLVLIALLHCQRAGHKVIALIGGATGRIGDPSGKSTERPMLPNSELEKNIEGIKENIEAVFKNHAKFYADQCKHDLTSSYKIVDNSEWYKDLTLLDFLSNNGRYFRVGKMLSRKSVKDRLESEEGISFTEFSYQIFQAYDWYQLWKRYKCTVQIGGSDQYGNIHAGHEFISRIAQERNLYAFTLPIITNETGNKLGKSADNCVWLSSKKTPSFDFFQYFIRLQDKDAENLLKLITLLPMNEIRDVLSKHQSCPDKRHCQETLAEHLTLLVHGKAGLSLAKKSTQILYDYNIAVLATMSRDELREVFAQSDYVRLLFESGMSLLDLAIKVGCFRTEKDAIRIITGGGFYVNQVKCTNPEEILMPGMHIMANNMTLMRVGKKSFYLIDWTI